MDSRMNQNISLRKNTDNMVILKRETHQWLARTWWIGARKRGRLHILENMVLSICLPWVVMVGEELPAFYFSVSLQNSISTWKSWTSVSMQLSTTVVSHKKSMELALTLRTLLLASTFPFSICAISSLMEIRASQNLSISACKGIYINTTYDQNMGLKFY